MRLNQTEFFNRIGCPLVNPQWSWGAESETKLVLKGWKKESFSKDGVMYIYASLREDDSRNGKSERIRHLDAFYNGKPAYFIMSTKDPKKGNNFGSIEIRDVRAFKVEAFVAIDGQQYAKCPTYISFKELQDI